MHIQSFQNYLHFSIKIHIFKNILQASALIQFISAASIHLGLYRNTIGFSHQPISKISYFSTVLFRSLCYLIVR